MRHLTFRREYIERNFYIRRKRAIESYFFLNLNIILKILRNVRYNILFKLNRQIARGEMYQSF